MNAKKLKLQPLRRMIVNFAGQILNIASKLPSIIVTILILLILLLLGSWLLLRGVQLCMSLRSPSAEIALPIEGTEDEKKLSAQLPARLHELSIATPADYGFFVVPSVPLPIITADAPISTSKSVLEKLDLKIQNVAVWDAIKTFNSLFAPVHLELRAHVTDLSKNESIFESQLVTTQLVLGERVIESWSVSAPKKAEGESTPKVQTASAVLDDPVDKLLFKMTFSFAQSEKPEFRRWRTQVHQEAMSFTNWQSLRDYVHGSRSLRAFQDTLNHDDLDAAILFLNDLTTIQAPNDPYGLYFLGLALIIDRRNEEAATVFQHLQLLLDRKLKSELKWEEMLRESQYNQALAWGYTPESAAKAVGILDGLVQKLKKRVDDSKTGKEEAALRDAIAKGNKTATDARLQELMTELEAAKANTARENSDVLKLLALSYAQSAHSHATMLALPRSQYDYSTDHAAAIQPNIDSAREALSRVTAWTSAQRLLQPTVEQERWDATERIMKMRILHAEGYGTYQKAVYLAKQSDLEFHTSCEAAIQELEAANAERPNFSRVLQDLATIFADKRYDSKGDYLGLAQSLFDRTKAWVPNDYYQYEQLAAIHRRKAYMLRAPEDVKAEIKQGTDEASNALRHRPSSPAARIELARLNKRSWEVSRQEADATNVLKCFQDASAAFNDQPDFLEEYLSFVKDLAQTNYPSAKLDQNLVDVANSPGLDVGNQATLTDLRLRRAKAPWEAKGKKDDSDAESILKMLRDAASKLQKQQYVDDYIAIIQELAKVRDLNASGLKALAEELLDFAKSPEGEKRRAPLTDLADKILRRSREVQKPNGAADSEAAKPKVDLKD